MYCTDIEFFIISRNSMFIIVRDNSVNAYISLIYTNTLETLETIFFLIWNYFLVFKSKKV